MTFTEYILHQLREMKRELLTALDGVPEDEIESFEPCGHWPIAWIAEHCSEVADKFLYRTVHGSYLLSYAEHVEKWPSREPKPGDEYPPLGVLQDRWTQICDTVVGFVEDTADEDLQREYGKEPYINSILRVINHTNSHLRSLWCILGEKRVDEKFPEQQSFLA
jgi:hypothetical protein